MPASSAAQFALLPACPLNRIALLPNFALFIFAGSVTPGPNNIMILASGANFGIRRCLPHLSGIALGFAFMLATVGLGLSAVFLANPSLLTAVRVAGLVHSDGPGAGRRRGRPVTSDLRAGSAISVGQPEGLDVGDRRHRGPHRAGRGDAAGRAGAGADLRGGEPAQRRDLAGAGGRAAPAAGLPAALRRFNFAMAALLVLSILPMLRTP